MEDAIKSICDGIGPKWVQLYSRLGLDYRGRYQISSDYESMAQENVKHRRCALDTLRKWQKDPSVKEMSEGESLLKLLTCLQGVKGMNDLATELAIKHGIKLTGKAPSGQQHSSVSSTEYSDEGSGASLNRELIVLQSIIEDYDWLWKQSIDTNNIIHKFAILDICQLMKPDTFLQFCMILKLDKETIESIIERESLIEEQYYSALSIALERHLLLTFNDIKHVLLSCSRTDLVTLIINRINSCQL